MIMDMLDFSNKLNERKIEFLYSGPLWTEGIAEIGRTLKKQLEIDGVPVYTSQEIFSVFIEQLNNMLMYSVQKTQFKLESGKNAFFPKGTLAFGTEKGSFFIQTGNIMKNDNVELIKNRIDYLNSLDKEEIHIYYKEQMKIKDTNPESKGAGLGFIEIARRVSSKMEYSFNEVMDRLVFFTLFVTIGGKCKYDE
jgi:hypothetical protein